MPDDRLEQLLNEMRGESVPAEEIAAAKERVWRKLSAPASAACGEFRPELGAYLAGTLSESRRMLVDDHLSRCPECRRAAAEITGAPKVVPIARARRAASPVWSKWAVAAGLAVTALFLGRDRIDSAMAPGGARATVQSVNGSVYRLAGGIVNSGAVLREGERVRTGAGARAVLRLADGSLVEANERTEVAVLAAWSGQTIQLERGDVIVQAAKQRRGHLRVATRDSVVSVKGTVFAVSSGATGTLVSVVEGSVAVQQPNGDRMLKPGEQAASNSSLAAVPVRTAVAWSQDAEKFYSLLGEFSAIEKQIAASATLRTQARLLPYLPANPLVYGAIPNLGGTIQQAVTLIGQRSQENAALKEWWTSEQGVEIQKVLERVQSVTPSLGEEIVFVLSRDATGKESIPLLLAEVLPGQQAALKQALDQLAGAGGPPIPYQITDKLLAVSDSPAHVAAMLAQLGQGASSDFAAEIARRYQQGTGWLFGMNVAALNQTNPAGAEADLAGLSHMKHLFFEQRSGQGVDENSASLTFAGARSGISSWLAAPAAAGSADYVSSEAVFAISAATRNPRQAFDELLALAGRTSSSFAESFQKLEAETGVNAGNDIAGALGTDFTVAVERPTLPIPGWIAAVEVVNPSLLDSTVRRLVEAANRQLPAEEQAHQLVLGQEDANGRTWTTIRVASKPITLYWTYDRGYLVAGMDRALVARAIENRDGGFPLVRSARFQQRLPGAGSVHYSGFLWMSTEGALASLASLAPSPGLQSLLDNKEPILVVVSGETERIHASSRTRLTSVLLDLMAATGPGRMQGAKQI